MLMSSAHRIHLGVPAILAAALVLIGAISVGATDWITRSGKYTHDSKTGYRVHQYAPIAPVYHTPNPNRSVYRHVRSSLQVGDSIDNYHAVDEYGQIVRPYGEWRFPYRPFSVPYPGWGPQPIWGGGFGGYPYPVPFGGGVGGGIGSPYGPYGVINGSGFPPPWNDGSYPDVRRQQLPPQPLPVPSTNFNNNIIGNGNSIQNQ